MWKLRFLILFNKNEKRMRADEITKEEKKINVKIVHLFGDSNIKRKQHEKTTTSYSVTTRQFFSAFFSFYF